MLGLRLVSVILLSALAWPAAAQEASAPGEPDELAGDEAAIPAAEVEVSGRLADPQARRDEGATEAPASQSTPLLATAEVAIGMAPSFGLGLTDLSGLAGIAGLGGTVGMAARTDFTFAADPRVFLGVGLRVGHTEQPGATVLDSTQVEVPLIAQIYFETPVRGALVPTLRIVPAFRWRTYTISSTGTFATAGGRLDLGIGITWFVLDRLAIRILGDVGVGAEASYTGAQSNAVDVGVGANIGIVVRL